MARRSWVVLACLAAMAVAAWAGQAKAGGSPRPSRARAWAIKVAFAAKGGQVVEVAAASAEGGENPSATAAPLTAGSESPLRATATPERPDSVTTPLSATDPTASGTVEGAFAEAHVAGDTANARTGLGNLSGSGFSIANRLFTWEQQEQLMSSWIQTNKAIFDPLNAQMEALAPLLAPLGLKPPHFEPMAGLGFIDVMRGGLVSSTAEASSSPGFSSARASTALGQVRLFGGFVEGKNIMAEAVSESAAGAENRSARATAASLRVAGVDVAVEGGKLRVAGNDLASRSVLQPALDTLLATLAQAGLRVRAGETRADGDLREASLLELELVTPEGNLLISLAHAEASAATVGFVEAAAGAEREASPPTETLQEEAGSASLSASPVQEPPGTALASVEPSAPAGVSGGRGSRRALRPGLGISAARALRTTYLLLVVLGGMLAAGILPMLARVPEPLHAGKERGKAVRA